MKIINKFFICFVILNITFSISQQQFKHLDYISTFEEAKLPFVINENNFGNENLHIKIDSKYIHSLSDILPESYRYFGVAKIIFKNLTGIIINQKGSAGGEEERFYLLLYDVQGVLLCTFLLSQKVSDCSITIEDFSTIRKDWSIHKVSTYKEFNCSTDKIISEKKTEEEFSLSEELGIVPNKE